MRTGYDIPLQKYANFVGLETNALKAAESVIMEGSNNDMDEAVKG